MGTNLRLALIPGVFAVFTAWVPSLWPAILAGPGVGASLQALAGVLFLLLAGISLRFNRRKALFQSLVLGLFWFGLVAGDPALHPWYPPPGPHPWRSP